MPLQSDGRGGGGAIVVVAHWTSPGNSKDKSAPLWVPADQHVDLYDNMSQSFFANQ